MKEIYSKDEFNQVVKGTALVKLGAPWCAPCKVLDGYLEALSLEVDFPIYKVNIDELPEIAGALKVMSIPATFVFKDGKLSNAFIGVKSQEDIKNQHLYITGGSN